MICRSNINERIKRYGHLLAAIEENKDLYADSSPLQLTEKECNRVVENLNGDIYY